METSKYTIRIPEPCHEDWNKMTPDNKGRFCSSCSKSVVDFTDKTDQEIIDILQSANGERVCGHFRKSQVNRPLTLKVNLKELPRNMSATRVFAVALLMVFGSMLFSCYDHKSEKISKLEMIEQSENKNNAAVMDALPVADVQEQPAENTVKMEETTGQTQMLVGDVAYECTTTGGAVAEPPLLPETAEYIKGKIKTAQRDSVREMNDSTIAVQRLKGEVELVSARRKTETPDTTAVVQKDSSETKRVKTGHAYLGKVVIEPVRKNEVRGTDSSGILTESNRENFFIVYPNPGKGEFTMMYEVRKRTDVRVDLLNESGSLVKTIVNIRGQHEGKYQVPVNAADLPDGIYLLVKTSGNFKETKRVIIEK